MEAKTLVILLLLAVLAEIPYLYLHPELQSDEQRNLEQARSLLSEGALPDRQFRVFSVLLIGVFDRLGLLDAWTWVIGIAGTFAVYYFGRRYTKDPLHFTLLIITSSAYLLTGRLLTEKLQLVFLVPFLLSSTLAIESFFFLLCFTIKETAILFIPMKSFLKRDAKHLIFPLVLVIASVLLFPDMISKIIVHLPTSGIGVKADVVSVPRNIVALLLSFTPVSIWYLYRGFKKADKGILLCGALGLPLLLWSGSVDPRMHLFTVFFFSVAVTNVACKMKGIGYWAPIIANLSFFLLDAYNLTHGHVFSLSSIL